MENFTMRSSSNTYKSSVLAIGLLATAPFVLAQSAQKAVEAAAAPRQINMKEWHAKHASVIAERTAAVNAIMANLRADLASIQASQLDRVALHQRLFQMSPEELQAAKGITRVTDM